MHYVLAFLVAAAPVGESPKPAPTEDAPYARKLPVGWLVSDAGWLALDTELKRLQGVERLHKAENWTGVVLVGLVVGVVVGALAVGATWAWTTRGSN